MKKNILLIIILLFLSIPAIFPLFSQGFFPMHDDTQVARVSEMKDALSDGIFPVRWVENLGYGYGYPIFNFYAPFSYYIGGFFNILGFDSLIATKIMIGLGTLLAGVFMYLLAKEFWGRLGGFVSAMLYVYAPYHALNLYVRGAIAELWAYAFIPLVFFGLYKVFQNHQLLLQEKGKETKLLLKRKRWVWISTASIAFAVIILSHNLTAMMVSPFIFAYTVILIARSKINKFTTGSYLLFSLILGIMLSAFYWLPVPVEMKYTNVLSVVGGGSDYHDHFVCIPQLLDSPWAYGGSVPGCTDGLSFKVGKIHLLLAVLSLLPLILLRKNKKVTLPILLSIGGLGLSLLLTVDYSKFIWDTFSLMSFFQFPWRFLILVSFFISFLGGVFVLSLTGLKRVILCLLLVVAIIYVNIDVFAPSSIVPKSSQQYIDTSFIRWDTSKISDEYMPPGFQKPKDKRHVATKKFEVEKSIGSIRSESVTSKQAKAEILMIKDGVVKLNIAYFPAWQISVDGKNTVYKNTSTGLQLSLPKGKHTVIATYVQTPIEKAANMITLTGVIVLVAGIISSRKVTHLHEKRKEKNK